MTGFIITVGLAAAVTLVALYSGRQLLAEPGLGDLRTRLEALHRQVISWQAAHDHQVASLDRRMRDVEEAAGRAEEEARIVSMQMVELSRGLAERLDRVEKRRSGDDEADHPSDAGDVDEARAGSHL
jgi:TolA-binding protein